MHWLHGTENREVEPNQARILHNIAKHPRTGLEKHIQAVAPKGISTLLLARVAAYNAQVRRFGELPHSTRKTLRMLIDDADRMPVPKINMASQPGTRFAREWHGKMHVVDVGKNGVVYQGKTYRSLSEVARIITGTRWSGPRFFGP